MTGSTKEVGGEEVPGVVGAESEDKVTEANLSNGQYSEICEMYLILVLCASNAVQFEEELDAIAEAESVNDVARVELVEDCELKQKNQDLLVSSVEKCRE